jgi:hypothetical protein
MTKVFSFVLVGALGFPVIAAQGTPFSSNPNRSSLVVRVADGCGFNKYRDAQGVCRRKYVIGGRYEKRPLYGPCGGVNSHRVCNLYGQCWMVCN